MQNKWKETMEKETIKDSRSKDEFDFRYYERLESEGKVNTPIRAGYRKGGSVPVVIETVNPSTGELVQGLGITRYDNDPFVEEITEDEFYALCEQKLQKKTVTGPDTGMG